MNSFNYFRRCTPLWMAAVMAAATTACIDNDYDIDDIDLTVGLNKDINLPKDNNTQDVCLDDVLDLGNTDFLTIGEDGMYNIDAIDNDEFQAHQVVNRFPVAEKTYKGSYTINLGDFAPQKGKRKVKGADDEITFEAPMVDMDFSVVYQTTVVTRLEHIGFNTMLNVDFTFAKDLRACLSNIKEMRFTLPLCLECGKAAFKGDSIEVGPNNTLVLNNVSPAEGLSFQLNVVGIDLTETKADGSYMVYKPGQGFSFKGALNIGVVVSESAVDFDKVATAKDLTVHGKAVLKRFYVTSARGGFCPSRSFPKVGGVSLANMPSFLDDEGVNLDLYDPQLNINIYSNVPFANKMTGAVVSKDAKGNVIKRIDIPQFSYKANGHSIVSIRRRPAAVESDTTVLVIPEICDLIRNIPDSICLVDLVGKGDDSETADIELSKYYVGRLRLSVASGIALGEEAVIVYKKEYTGWNDQFKDIRFVETTNAEGQKTVEGYVKVNANIENKIPAFLRLSAAGIDANGNEIGDDRLAVEVQKVIQASKDGVTPAKTEEVIVLRPKDPEVFKALDGIKCRIEMVAKNGKEKVTGVKLNAYKQTIKVTDIAIQKVGKVAIDLN